MEVVVPVSEKKDQRQVFVEKKPRILAASLGDISFAKRGTGEERVLGDLRAL